MRRFEAAGAPDINPLLAAQPPFGDYQIANAANAAIANKIKGSTPGRATTPYLGVKGDPFREIFFPEYAAVALEDQVADHFGKSGGFFADWAISALCQTMDRVTSSLRKQLITSKINADMGARNQQMTGFARAGWYGVALSILPGAVRSALEAIPIADRPEALQLYAGDITSAEWIDFRLAEGALWTHPDWELFHHYVKLVTLGAPAAMVDAVITTQKERGLPIPANVDLGQWSRYAPWGNDVSYRAFEGDASPGILKEVCYVYPGSSWPSCMKESNAFEFTAMGQPGNPYRETPSSSCFRAGTRVVMAGGALKAIEEVRAGDEVATPQGTKTVVQLATSFLQDRQFQQFPGSGFAFTGAHPFVSANMRAGVQPAFVAAEPLRAMQVVPGIGRLGMSGFNHRWTPDLLAYAGGVPAPTPAPPVGPIGGGAADEVVYDVIVDVADDGISEYFAGDEVRQYAVSSEIPRFANIPDVTEAFVAMLEACREAIGATLEHYPPMHYMDLLASGLAGLSEKVVPMTVHEIQAAPSPSLVAARVHTEADARAGVAGLLSAPGAPGTIPAWGPLSGPAGAIYATLAIQLGIPFYLACALGWRQFPLTPANEATLLALTVNAIELDGEGAFSDGDSFELDVTLSRAGARFTRTLPAFQNGSGRRYYHACEQVTYFSEWRLPPPDDPGPWVVSFGLRDRSTGATLANIAATTLPDTLDVGYAFLTALVQAPDTSVIGLLSFDIRPLTAASYEAEVRAKRDWTPAKASAFASDLGRLGGQYLAEQFTTYLKVFGVMTTAKSRGLIPPIDPALTTADQPRSP